MPGERRHEQELTALSLILRADSPVGESVCPQLHTVRICAPEKRFTPSSKPTRQTNVDGLSTTEFAVNQDSPEGRAVGSPWLNREGILMRCVDTFETKNGKLTTIDWQWLHVEIGEHDAALFEILHGFARLPPEPAISLLGVKVDSASAH